MLDGKDPLKGYRNSSLASKGAQEILTSGVSPNINDLPEGVDDDQALNSHSAIEEDSESSSMALWEF